MQHFKSFDDVLQLCILNADHFINILWHGKENIQKNGIEQTTESK